MAYYVNTPETAAAAAYARSLQGYLWNAPRELNALGALRFNRAVARGMYQLPFYEATPQKHLGQIEADPTLLLGGIGLLALGMFLLGRPKKRRHRRRPGRLARAARGLFSE